MGALGPAPAFAQQQALPRIAVYGFSAQGLTPWWGGSFDPGDAISDIMTDKLVNAGTFNVIDRTHIQQVLSEQNLSHAGDVSPSSEAKLGRMFGASYLVVGRIIEFDKTGGTSGGSGLPGNIPNPFGHMGGGSQKITLHVSMKIIEANTGRIAASADDEESKSGNSFSLSGFGGANGASYTSADFANSTMGQLLSTVAEDLVKKIQPEKLTSAPVGPTISAKILAVDGANVIINAGSNKNVTSGEYFTVYQTKEFRDPDSGKMLESHTKRGTIQITSVDKETSTGTMVDGTARATWAAISGE